MPKARHCQTVIRFPEDWRVPWSFADSSSLIALNSATIDVIAASIVPEATAMLPRAPNRSSDHSSGGIASVVL